MRGGWGCGWPRRRRGWRSGWRQCGCCRFECRPGCVFLSTDIQITFPQKVDRGAPTNGPHTPWGGERHTPNRSWSPRRPCTASADRPICLLRGTLRRQIGRWPLARRSPADASRHARDPCRHPPRSVTSKPFGRRRRNGWPLRFAIERLGKSRRKGRYRDIMTMSACVTQQFCSF